VSVTSKERM